MKPITDHLNTLPPGYRERALQNFADYPIYTDPVKNLGKAITCFSWTNSPEGFKFWLRVSLWATIPQFYTLPPLP